MLLVGEILLLLVIAWIVVCVVNMITKKWIAYAIVLLCLALYALVISTFFIEADYEHQTGHDHSKCK